MSRFIIHIELSHEDLQSRGYCPNVDNATMKLLVDEIGKSIFTCDFWTALDLACEKYKVKKIAVS